MWASLARKIVLNRYSAFLGVVFLYLLLMNERIELTKGIWQMEIPVLLYAYFWLNSLTKPSRWQPVAAAVPLAFLYLLHDYYYFRFFRIPRIIEVTQIRELLEVVDPGFLLALAGLALLFIFLIAIFTRLTLKGFILSLPLVVLVGSAFILPDRFIQAYSSRSIEVIHYSTVINVEYNGRIVTALYNEAKRRETLSRMSRYRDIGKLSLVLPDEIKGKVNGRNVHLIVLEGFIDFSYFENFPEKLNPA
ncbi:MAG: hypothetical protein HQL59_12620, partial [Magnetococcales bacterium]|nr:hypothetical protein [Magnetococcales bacterium]